MKRTKLGQSEIKPQYDHSKVGNFMFELCAKWTEFIIRHKFLYFILSITWGFIMTFLGWIISLVLLAAKFFSNKISFEKFGWIYCCKVGPDYWGGFEMGLMFVRDQKSTVQLSCHEWAHTTQNCLFGPLFPFIVAIPSACRWWARTIFPKKNWPAYAAAWFEDAADQCGLYMYNYIKSWF